MGPRKSKSRTTVTPTVTYAYLVGRVIGKLRTDAAMDQGELATAVGISQSTWSKVERGRSALTVEQLARCADAIGIVPSVLLARVEDAVRRAQERGIVVSYTRDPGGLDEGVAILGAAAVGAIIAAALSPKR